MKTETKTIRIITADGHALLAKECIVNQDRTGNGAGRAGHVLRALKAGARAVTW